MMLPVTLAEIQAMGRDALNAIVRCYMSAWGLDAWDITARWVEDCQSDSGTAVGSCSPDPVYHRALIEILWPPQGDVEETIAHELAHCLTAELAMLADAGPGTWARAAWEHVAEQMARGAVALRRRGMRSPQVLSRVFRSTFAAARRNGMDPKQLAELAMKAGEMAGRDDVPEDVRQLLTEFVAALAGGGTDPAPPEETKQPDPNAPAPAATQDPDTGSDKAPAYMRKLLGEFSELKAKVERLAAPPAPPAAVTQPSPELLEVRRTSVETFLTTKPGVLSADAERQLIADGDLKLARRMVAEVERKHVERGGQKPPGSNGGAPRLTQTQLATAARHKLTPEQFAGSLSRQIARREFVGRGGKVQ